MRQKKEYLLVDGYNIIHAWKDLKKLMEVSLLHAREKLLDTLSDYQGYRNINIIVVFDAHLVKGNVGSEEKRGNITVVYTKEAETADSYIERTTNAIVSNGKRISKYEHWDKRYDKIRVATSDKQEQMIILGQGAIRIPAERLKQEIIETKKEIEKKYIENRPIKKNLLFDNLDEETAEKLNKMRLNKNLR